MGSLASALSISLNFAKNEVSIVLIFFFSFLQSVTAAEFRNLFHPWEGKGRKKIY